MKKTKEDIDGRSNSLNPVNKNKKSICAAIVVIYFLIILTICIITKWDIENIYYISQIINGIFIVAGLVVSVLQYISSGVESAIMRDKEKKIKAAEMANKFQKEIIPLSSMLASAYKKSGLEKRLLHRIEKEKLEMFNREEVGRFVKEEDISRAYIELYIGYLLNKGKKIKAIDGKITDIFEYDDRVEAEKTIDNCIQELANKLEYFGICFNSEIADEDTVYQSLHKVFFNCVHMLYVFIFYSNVSESDRLFSNISSLYIRWHDRYEKLVEQEKEELSNLKKKVKNKIVVNAKK